MRRRLKTFVIVAGLGSACYLGGGDDQGQPDSGGGGPDSGVVPFQADTPYVYVAKVKNILTGLAPLQSEVDAVLNAPDQPSKQAVLVGLIDQWMMTTQYQSKMLRFFQLAFQQTQISQADFNEIVPNGNGSIGTSPMVNLLVQNAMESFARTVLYEISQSMPLNAAFTTNQFMMTPALAELYAFMDWNAINDADNITDKFAAQPTIKANGIVVEDTTALTYAQTLDSTNSATYMHWYFPGLSTIQPTQPTGCQADTRTWVSTNFNNQPSAHLVHYLLYGGLESYKINNGPPPNNNCNAYQSGTNANAIMQASDFADTSWQLVTIAPPDAQHPVTPFWDMNQIRAAAAGGGTLYLNIPRIGFFSTPAFHANWQTNTSNQMRVTMNQAFIVALGAQVDGTDPTNPGVNPPGLDSTHATQPACVGCHQQLDPSRSLLMTYYSDGYGVQTTPPSTKGEFVFNNQATFASTPYNTLTDLGNALASHPFFANAWVQKLCYYVNSEGCDLKDSDPELARITTDFINSKYSWTKLVEDLLSSPITTNAVATITTTNEGELVSVTRKDHLCTLLNSRLGLVDSCGLDIVTTKNLVGIPEIAAGLPSDGYGRGAPVPVLPVSPTLFYRAGLENMCEDAALEVIDAKTPPPGAKQYSSSSQTNVNAAIADFVANLMAVMPDDPRSPIMVQKLTAHYQQAMMNSATASDALKSTFVVACLSPNVAGIGM
jgi:hypothetical protein